MCHRIFCFCCVFCEIQRSQEHLKKQCNLLHVYIVSTMMQIIIAFDRSEITFSMNDGTNASICIF